MNFLQELGSHRGGLVRIKTQLYWCDGRGWDGVHDRVCLLLNTDAASVGIDIAAATATLALSLAVATPALLLIDGRPQWVWVDQEDVELL